MVRMAIFKRTTTDEPVGMDAYLGQPTRFAGRLEFSGTVRIDGRFEGEIASSGTLVLGRNAEIEGTVSVGTLVCDGKVRGEIRAAERVELQSRAVVVGAISGPVLIVDDGAVFQGRMTMRTRAVSYTGPVLVEDAAASGLGAAVPDAD